MLSSASGGRAGDVSAGWKFTSLGLTLAEDAVDAHADFALLGGEVTSAVTTGGQVRGLRRLAAESASTSAGELPRMRIWIVVLADPS